MLVGSVGFEPTKASPTDLQSVPIGHSGNSPDGGRIYLTTALRYWGLKVFRDAFEATFALSPSPEPDGRGERHMPVFCLSARNS